jgi:hypothetical protein
MNQDENTIWVFLLEEVLLPGEGLMRSINRFNQSLRVGELVVGRVGSFCHCVFMLLGVLYVTRISGCPNGAGRVRLTTG